VLLLLLVMLTFNWAPVLFIAVWNSDAADNLTNKFNKK